MGKGRQCGSSSRNCFALTCQQCCSQGLGHACSTIIGGTSSDADDEIVAPILQSRSDEFAHAVGGCDARVALIGRDKGQSGSGGHFDGSRASISQQAKECLHGCAKRPCHGLLHNCASGGVHESLDCPFTSIGDWHNIYLSLWKNSANT